MSTDAPLKRLRAIMECKSNDFAELLKLSGLDIKKDFVGADLTSVDFGSYDYKLINLHDTIIKNATHNGRLISKNIISRENFKDYPIIESDNRGR